jgi:hypothetical protein
LPIEAGAHEVLEETLRIEQQVERETEKQLVEELLAANGHHPVTHGLQSTVRALCEGRIWRLVYASGFSANGGRCPNCGMLFAKTEGSCDYCGAAIAPVTNLLERMIESVLESDSGRVEEVAGEAARRLQQVGGIGAVLRFSIREYSMLTKEIPREQWVRFFNVFSKQHAGWIVTLEVISLVLGDQEEVTRLPLVGISADVKDRENRIDIIVGGRPDAHLTHGINAPKRVWLKEPEEVAHETIAVESEDGTMTLVRFQHVPLEETERQLPPKT